MLAFIISFSPSKSEELCCGPICSPNSLCSHTFCRELKKQANPHTQRLRIYFINYTLGSLIRTLADSFCKEPDVNFVGCGPYGFCHRYSSRPRQGEGSHRQFISERACLCLEKTLFINTEFEFYRIFMCHKIVYSLHFSSQALKCKNHSLLSALQKQVAKQIEPVGGKSGNHWPHTCIFLSHL